MVVLGEKLESEGAGIAPEDILNRGNQYPEDYSGVLNLMAYQQGIFGKENKVLTKLFPGWKENGELVSFMYPITGGVMYWSTPLEQAGMLYRWSLRLLWAWDIDACLGWSTEETDAAVAKQFPEIGPGAYTRAAVLMERVLYGGMAPEPYELRALQTFLDKLACHRPQELRRRMRRIITAELWKKLHRPAGKAGAA